MKLLVITVNKVLENCCVNTSNLPNAMVVAKNTTHYYQTAY